ncbi:protein SMAX1-LIKE 3-like [Quillaja saponaria]|uniref:Protein SMAX1-LIKE 3-like n=1 Tax=Quillaja saponaria TaxID=32244 RepID=A0AAD7VDL1_QUISA|nr:protein SMAX1-LIKE 3-like [Quillaja saponaria]
MRTGGCTVQQALTTEAGSIIKQAVTLAKRRGHAQVTPLHVANTMLSASSGLLRTACLQSNSHPLQCKALELCFNVALNRLPASNSSPMLGTTQFPSISNALVAAFKRAQAHQRRGSIENQQQPLLAVKIEMEQLIISILDDPSVSRVMREAGFSSTQVKSNVEQAVSLEICSQTQSISPSPSLSNKSKESNNHLTLSHQSQPQPPSQVVEKSLESDQIRTEDVMSVIDNLMNQRRRSTVIVGECVALLEGVVKGAMDKIEQGAVDEVLKKVKIISLSLSSFDHLSRINVEQRIGEFKNLGKGVVFYVGDLKLVFDYRARSSEQGRGYYCPVEHMIMEIGKLVYGSGENNERFWLIGIATFQTYMRCKTGYPSLEAVLGLHPLTIPADSLRLSLIIDSDLQSQSTSNKADNGASSWLLLEGRQEKELTCCAEPSSKFDTQIRSLQSSSCNSDSTTNSSLPAWLQQYKNETKGISTNEQNCVPLRDLCKKLNSTMCSSIHKQSYPYEKTLTFSSLSPSSSTSGFSNDQHHHEWPVREPKNILMTRDHHFWMSENGNNIPNEPSLRVYIPEYKDIPKQPVSPSNPNYSNPNSTSSSNVVMETEYVSRFKEMNAENLKALCNALEKKVPWQKNIMPEIASTILQCRSGMLRRKSKAVRSSHDQVMKEETWLVFQSVDTEAKEKIARELAKLVFASHTNFVTISLSSFSSTRADSTDQDCRNKRSRDEQSCSYIKRFADAVSSNPHRVFLVEDVEQADYCSQLGFKKAIESGRIVDSNGEEVGLSDAIIILSCESFSSRSRASSPPVKQKSSENGSQEGQKSDNATEEETNPCVSLDLNISIDDDINEDDDQSIDDIGLLESVDGWIIFKIQEL